MVAWRYEISLLVLKKYFTRSQHSLVKYFSTLEEKFRISTRHVISSISIYTRSDLNKIREETIKKYDI